MKTLLILLTLTTFAHAGIIMNNPYAVTLNAIDFQLKMMQETDNIALYKESIRRIKDEIERVKDREFAEALAVLREELDMIAEEELLKIAKERRRVEKVLNKYLKQLKDKFAPIGAGVQMGCEAVKKGVVKKGS